LKEDMRHKIGYAKPLGLGSISLFPTYLKLIDYHARYTRTGPTQGITTYEGDALWSFLDEQIDTFSAKHLLPIAMEDLGRIWRWPPDPDVDYYYPSKRDWFDTEEGIGKSIADTKYAL
ncbi:MAG TPA: hypothetical protein VFV38_12720, partial [Ktedonobacteraceae bacterium]|nr:hypothetical protein [Ktedonobacteraceae bacterium]